MTTINLRELYPWYTEDAFIEVSDEVAAFLEEDKVVSSIFRKKVCGVWQEQSQPATEVSSWATSR